jgi:membrane protein
VWKNIGRHRLLAIAAGITYYGLLALFPGIAAAVALYGLVADPHSAQHLFDQLSGVLPGGAQTVLSDEVKRLTSQPATHLGFAFFVGVATSLWAASSGLRALGDALNIVYGEEEKRGFVKLYGASLLATVIAILFFFVVTLTLVALPIALKYLWFASSSKMLINVLRWPILFCLIAFAFSLVYHYGPSHEERRWRLISWGSAAASLGWLIVSLLFSWYAANFGSYDKTYGSLGAVAGFMTWMWLSAVVVLIGGEINAQLERVNSRPSGR